MAKTNSKTLIFKDKDRVIGLIDLNTTMVVFTIIAFTCISFNSYNMLANIANTLIPIALALWFASKTFKLLVVCATNEKKLIIIKNSFWPMIKTFAFGDILEINNHKKPKGLRFEVHLKDGSTFIPSTRLSPFHQQQKLYELRNKIHALLSIPNNETQKVKTPLTKQPCYDNDEAKAIGHQRSQHSSLKPKPTKKFDEAMPYQRPLIEKKESKSGNAVILLLGLVALLSTLYFFAI